MSERCYSGSMLCDLGVPFDKKGIGSCLYRQLNKYECVTPLMV
jgi:hypothetical protein